MMEQSGTPITLRSMHPKKIADGRIAKQIVVLEFENNMEQNKTQARKPGLIQQWHTITSIWKQ